jgi:hypothetical protein
LVNIVNYGILTIIYTYIKLKITDLFPPQDMGVYRSKSPLKEGLKGWEKSILILILTYLLKYIKKQFSYSPFSKKEVMCFPLICRPDQGKKGD